MPYSSYCQGHPTEYFGKISVRMEGGLKISNFFLSDALDKEMITRNIEAVSNISDINVDTPFNWLSPDPTRAKMQSVMEISAELHGTKHPS